MQEINHLMNNDCSKRQRRRSLLSYENIPISSLSKQSASRDISKNNLRSIVLKSLPHLTILLLFLVYSLIGAAIFKEIETDSLNDKSKFNTKNYFDLLNLKKEIEKYENEFEMRRQEFNAKYIFIQNMLIEHQTKINLDITNLNKKLNLTNKHDDSLIDTLNFIDKLNFKSPGIKTTLTNHMSEYKTKLKLKMQKKTLSFIENHHREQADFETVLSESVHELENLFYTRDIVSDVHKTSDHQTVHRNLEDISKFIDKALNIDETCFQAECSIKKNERRNFMISLNFIVASLTSIGFRGIMPQTIVGKLFTIIYLIFGLPLTLILLSDIGKLITIFLNFLMALYKNLCTETYYDPLRRYLEKSRFPFTGFVFSLVFSRTKKTKLQSSQSQKQLHQINKNSQFNLLSRADSKFSETNRETQVDMQLGQKNILELFKEIFLESFKQSNDIFNFSFGFLAFIIFLYTSCGTLLGAQISNQSVIDGYYFSMLTMSQIDSGDIEFQSIYFMLASIFYVLIGMAFFSLTIKFLKEKIRGLFLMNGEAIITEIIKFSTQFGYNLKQEDFNLTLSNEVSRIPTATVETQQIKKKESIEQIQIPIKLDQTRVKCDKATQITTLLYSKLKNKKENFMPRQLIVITDEETPIMKQIDKNFRPYKIQQNGSETSLDILSSTPTRRRNFS